MASAQHALLNDRREQDNALREETVLRHRQELEAQRGEARVAEALQRQRQAAILEREAKVQAVEEALRAREQQMATQMEEVQSLEAAGGLTPETGTSAAPASSSSSSLTPATGTSAAPASTSSSGGLHQTKRAP